MKIKNQLSLKRLIGKIDNDFNISESDWIPRVAAWVTDALSQMKVLPMERKRRELEVSERIAQFPCEINGKELRIFDKCNNEIPSIAESQKCGCSGSGRNIPNSEIAVFNSCNKTGVNAMNIATVTNGGSDRYFVLDGNNIELNFNTDKIIVESYEVATYYDDYFDCECPYIYDNGLLLEALAWYCLFKYLSRGSTHQVYSLKTTTAVLNPYMQWLAIKPKAEASVKIDLSKAGDGWNNFFYNSTFLPRG